MWFFRQLLAFLGQRALTIEHSVMSGHGQGHESVLNEAKFLKLTSGRSGNTSKKRWDGPHKTIREINLVYGQHV